MGLADRTDRRSMVGAIEYRKHVGFATFERCHDISDRHVGKQEFVFLPRQRVEALRKCVLVGDRMKVGG